MSFSTTDGKIIDIEELTWAQARTLIAPLNQELVNIIDELSPGDQFTLYKAKYPYGMEVISETESLLPLANGEGISFNDPALPKALAKQLNYNPYNSNPVGIVLQKSSEFYLQIENRILPYSMVAPGDTFGFNRILDKIDANVESPRSSLFMWRMTSGARSLFMLPKIGHNASHTKLKKAYRLGVEKPNGYEDHFPIFKELAKQTKAEWRSEFLFFSNNWFEQLNDPAWLKLYTYMLRKNRLSYEFWRNILSWEITFNIIEQSRNIKSSAYILDTAKHLFAIAEGAFPGYRPAQNNESAPVDLIQKAYLETYEINTTPIIMEPALFKANQAPVYYSLSHPTLVQNDPYFLKNAKTIIVALDDLTTVVNKYLDGIQKNSLAQSTSLYHIATSLCFDYYHHAPSEIHHPIKDASMIPIEDTRFADKQLAFPDHSTFVRGCIKLSDKKPDDNATPR